LPKLDRGHAKWKNDLAIQRTISGAPEAASNGKMNEQKQNRRFICDRNINTDRPQQQLL